MKKTNLALLAVFLLVIFAVPVLTLYGGLTAYSGWSVYENRALASVPQLSTESVTSGVVFDQLEDFFSDHVFRRDSWLRAYTAVQLQLFHKPVVNDVVVTGTVLLPSAAAVDYDADALQRQAVAMADSLAAIQTATEENGGVFLYVGIPEQRTALRDGYPDELESGAAYYDAQKDAFVSAMAQQEVNLLLMDDTLAQTGNVAAYYYLTDHHYNLRGAYLTYQTVCQTLTQLGEPVTAAEVTFSNLPNPFLGTYSRKLYGLSPVEESLVVATPVTPVSYTRWDNGVKTDAPVILLPETATEPVYYASYMGGDQAETILDTGRDELPKILVVGDSFTNAFESLAYLSFSELRSLDFRHYTDKSLCDYIADYQPDVVLVMRDDVSFLSTAGNGNLQ